MEYKVRCDNKAIDLWKLNMNQIYHSMAGVINIVFTVSMLLLTIRFFGTASSVIRGLLILATLWFVIFHPLAIYGQCIKQLEHTPKDVELTFREKNIRVTSSGKSEEINWNKIKVMKKFNMLIVMSDTSHGYILTDRVLGEDREKIYELIKAKTA